MAEPPLTIHVDPDSELGRALHNPGAVPVVPDSNGPRFRVSRGEDDPWADYDPERVRAGLRQFAGMVTPRTPSG